MIVRALLVGIDSYRVAPLRGAKNDMDEMFRLLTGRFGVPQQNITTLANKRATRAQILEALKTLGDSPSDGGQCTRLFYFAGHGTQRSDESGDEEVDGADECLVPVDVNQAGVIADDDLADFYDRCPPQDDLVLIVDACHSGTLRRPDVEDFRARYRPPSPTEQRAVRVARERADTRRDEEIQKEWKGKSEPQRDAVRRVYARRKKLGFQIRETKDSGTLVTACRENETAGEALFDGVYRGVFTYHLAKVAEGPLLSYQRLIERTTKAMSADAGRGIYQTPQLECADEMLTNKFLAS